MRKEKCGIYQIKCETTGKIYIGSSAHANQREYTAAHKIEKAAYGLS